MILAFYAAVGYAIALIGWVVVGLIRNDWLRAILRSLIVAVFVTPTIIAGHGVAPAPAYILVFEKTYAPWGWIPIVVIWAILLVVFSSVRKIRTSRTDWPINWPQVLFTPVYFKPPLYGLFAFGIMVGLSRIFESEWYVQILWLIGGGLVNYAICYSMARYLERANLVVPALYPLLTALSGLVLLAGFWYLFGLGGQMFAAGKRVATFSVGAITTGALGIYEAWRALKAYQYQDMAHIKIQGGVTGNASIAAVSILCALIFLYFYMRESRRIKDKNLE